MHGGPWKGKEREGSTDRGQGERGQSEERTSDGKRRRAKEGTFRPRSPSKDFSQAAPGGHHLWTQACPGAGKPSSLDRSLSWCPRVPGPLLSMGQALGDGGGWALEGRGCLRTLSGAFRLALKARLLRFVLTRLRRLRRTM